MFTSESHQYYFNLLSPSFIIIHVVTESSLYTVSGIVLFGFSEQRNKSIRQVVAYERLKTM